MRRISKIALLVAFTMTAAVVNVTPADAVTTAERKVAVGLANRINAERAARFASQPLYEWFFVTTEAESHSAYQAAQKRISHDGFCDDANGDDACDTPPGDGNSTNSRLDRIWAAGSGIGHVCENVAVTVRKDTVRKAVRALFKLWDLSPPHNACMFRASARWAGIGIKRKGTSKWYATFIAADDSSPANP